VPRAGPLQLAAGCASLKKAHGPCRGHARRPCGRPAPKAQAPGSHRTQCPKNASLRKGCPQPGPPRGGSPPACQTG